MDVEYPRAARQVGSSPVSISVSDSNLQYIRILKFRLWWERKQSASGLMMMDQPGAPFRPLCRTEGDPKDSSRRTMLGGGNRGQWQ